MNPVIIQEVRRLTDAEPFQPFILHLADGRRVSVQRRELLGIAPSGRTLAIFQLDDALDFVTVSEITRIAT